GVLLVTEPDGSRLAMLVRSGEMMDRRVHVQVVCADTTRAEAVAGRLRELVIERNVFRGRVVSFGDDIFGQERGASPADLPDPAARAARAPGPARGGARPDPASGTHGRRASGRLAGRRAAPATGHPALRPAGHRQDPHDPAP